MKFLGLSLLALLGALLAPTTVAQSTLPTNTFVVVTSDGLWIPDAASSTPRLHIPATDFPNLAPGQSTLTRPAIEWYRATDSFLVSAGPQLFEVTISSLAPPVFAITDITPSSTVVQDFWDLDVHPGTDELYVLEQTLNEVLRFEPPFAANMSPNLVIAAPPTSRGMSVDSRSDPNSVIVTETSQVTRLSFSGAQSVVGFLGGARGVDTDPQSGVISQHFIVTSATNQVVRVGNSPNITTNLNELGNCSPLAISPQDIEWNPNNNRAYVLAGDGINQSLGCQVQIPAQGINHVVSTPLVKAPPVVIPKLRTYGPDSGITGVNGDLTLVLNDFAFVSPFGESCVAGTSSTMKLDSVAAPELDFDEFILETSEAPELAPLFLVLGFAPDSVPLAGGCQLLVVPQFLRFVGMTDADGELALTVPKPPDAVAGYEAFAQTAALVAGQGVVLSQGLQLHLGQ